MVKDQTSHDQIKLNGQAQITEWLVQVRSCWRHWKYQKLLIAREVLKGTKTYLGKKVTHKNVFEDSKCVVGYFTSGRTHLNVQGSVYPVIIGREIYQRIYGTVLYTSHIIYEFC